MMHTFGPITDILRKLLPAAAIYLAATASAHPQTIAKFATTLPENSIMIEQIYDGLVTELNAQLDGEVVVQMFGPAFADTTKVWERVSSGVADMGIVLLQTTGKPFARASVTTLPDLADDIVASSKALWQLYSEGMFKDEFDGVRVMSLNTVPASKICSVEPIESHEQLQGMFIRSSDKNSSEALSALGASPVAIPFSELFQAFQSKMTQAALCNSVSLTTAGLSELVNYQISNVPFGMIVTGVVMNQNFYDSLSEKAKMAFDRFSGEEASQWLAHQQVKLDNLSYEIVRESKPEFRQIELPQEELEKLETSFDTVKSAWTERTPDGDEVLNAFRSAYEEALKK